MEIINLEIDGMEVKAKKGQTVLEAALEKGIYIPHLCYHPDLRPLGNCKLCSVKIEGEDKLVQSCETLAEEGMVIDTKSDEVMKLRNISLELMLASHPSDCTSCDKYLHCELQAIMQYIGVSQARMRTIEKNNIKIASSDGLIKKEMHRCIQCGRCIRVCEEVRGVNALSLNKKNGETYVNTHGDVLQIDSDCRYCGACIEICPTGAIQDAQGVLSRNVSREWALVPCKQHCPAHTDIPEYVRLTKEGLYGEAVSVIREKLTFPHSLGYICNHACESGCKRTYLNEPIAIRETKLYAVEHDTEEVWKKRTRVSESNGKRVCVIGGGPAGMTSAYLLAKKGYLVDVFERNEFAGGMLSYGIPNFRLSKDIVRKEIQILQESGLNLITGETIESLDHLSHYDAVLLAIGANEGKRPTTFHSKWENAIDAVDFCRQAIEKNLPNIGKTITIYGGGNVAFDCARNAKREGAETVRVLCLEKSESMLADKEEIDEAINEGIEVLSSSTILEIHEKNNNIKEIVVATVRNFFFDDEGLKMDLEENSERTLETDTLVFATGQQPERFDFGVDYVNGNHIKVDDNLSTSKPGIFAAGDAVYGTKSVVEAIASGREAASKIDVYLGGDGNMDETLYERSKPNPNIGVIQGFSKMNRVSIFQNQHDARFETNRCLQCDLRIQLQKVKYWVDPHFKRK